MAGLLLDDFIQTRIRLHRTVLVRKDVAVEISEKRKVVANVADRQIVGIGKNISGKASLAEMALNTDHRLDGRKNVGEETAEDLQIVGKAGFRAELVIELLFAHQAGFITEQQRRLGDET